MGVRALSREKLRFACATLRSQALKPWVSSKAFSHQGRLFPRKLERVCKGPCRWWPTWGRKALGGCDALSALCVRGFETGKARGFMSHRGEADRNVPHEVSRSVTKYKIAYMFVYFACILSIFELYFEPLSLAVVVCCAPRCRRLDEGSEPPESRS